VRAQPHLGVQGTQAKPHGRALSSSAGHTLEKHFSAKAPCPEIAERVVARWLEHARTGTCLLTVWARGA
jgi:hypothetical protein